MKRFTNPGVHTATAALKDDNAHWHFLYMDHYKHCSTKTHMYYVIGNNIIDHMYTQQVCTYSLGNQAITLKDRLCYFRGAKTNITA